MTILGKRKQAFWFVPIRRFRMGTSSRIYKMSRTTCRRKLDSETAPGGEQKRLSINEKIWHFWRTTKTLKSVGATGNVIVL